MGRKGVGGWGLQMKEMGTAGFRDSRKEKGALGLSFPWCSRL